MLHAFGIFVTMLTSCEISVIQVSRAAHVASDGQVMASPEAIAALASCCKIATHMQCCDGPVCIATRGTSFVPLREGNSDTNIPGVKEARIPIYENLRKHCSHMQLSSISKLHTQMALYVHPVVRSDGAVELRNRANVDAQSRHRAEAELRSVYTMFIKALVSPVTTGRQHIDDRLFETLRSIMHVTSR